MSNYLITGGAGFIGSNLVKKLTKRGYDVRVLDNFSTGRRANLWEITSDIELIEGDLRSYHLVEQAVDGIDYILHQGALPSVPRSVRDPVTSSEVNITGTLNLLDAAVAAGVKRVVYASSSSVYGDNPTLPKAEEMIPSPLSPYAVTKLTGEYFCRVFNRIYGLETISLRYFNVFGPNQDPNSEYAAVIPKFIRSIQHGEQPIIYGDGTQSRDFTFVDNVIEANMLACKQENVSGEVINIACGERYTLLDLVAALNDIMGTSIEPRFVKPRPGEVKHSLASIEKARSLMGYESKVDFIEGLKRTVNYFEKSDQ
ncbi:MAG: SDR family oxidoreductase [Chloroflexota bacterium]|nr:MAG: SDR family oxidoreductase [Chloroflexota bacterium]